MNRLSLVLALLLLTMPQISNETQADEKFGGNVIVSGTLSAKEVTVGRKQVATMDSLDALKKDLLTEVVKEITERLKFHYNSPEVRALSDQITNSVIKTIGGSTKAADDLKKELDAIDRSSSAQMTELKRTIATLESESQRLQKDLNSLKQEMVEMRKELSRKR